MTARALPILRFRGRRWFFDERLAEVRDAECPWNRVQLSRDLVTALKLFGEFEPDGTAHKEAVQEKRPASGRGR